MKTFVIYDRKSGEILQFHTEMGDPPSIPEELLATARPGVRLDDVDVMEVADLEPGARYRVDVKVAKLIRVERGGAGSSAGASLQPLRGDLHTARTIVMHAVGSFAGIPASAQEREADMGPETQAQSGQSGPGAQSSAEQRVSE